MECKVGDKVRVNGSIQEIENVTQWDEDKRYKFVGVSGWHEIKDTIKLIGNESGNWEVLLLNGKVYEEGRRIPAYTWINLIRDLGHEVSMEELTDEEMGELEG